MERACMTSVPGLVRVSSAAQLLLLLLPKAVFQLAGRKRMPIAAVHGLVGRNAVRHE